MTNQTDQPLTNHLHPSMERHIPYPKPPLRQLHISRKQSKDHNLHCLCNLNPHALNVMAPYKSCTLLKSAPSATPPQHT